MELREMFKKHDSEYLKFDRVQGRRSSRPDLHAFLLLDKLIPGYNYIVAGSEHDEFFLGIDPKKLEKVATEEHVIELIRCGVMYTGEGLSMFA